MAPEPTELAAGRIEQWKARLIDTSKRNRLLYFKPSKRGTVQLLQPGADDLYDTLVRRGKPLKFSAVEPRSDLFEEGEGETFTGEDLPDLDRSEAHAPDEPLTGASPKELWRTLDNLRKRSRESLAEQGVVSLYLAFGFLEWAESDASDLLARSPLILAPVELKHTAAHEPYTLSLFEEDVTLNPTLLHKLRTDFGLELPPLPGLDTLDVESYFDEVEAAIAGYARWTTLPEVWLGLFSFLKINMWKDLSSHADRAGAHPLIKAIAGDASAHFEQTTGLVSLSAEQLDAAVHPLDTYEIVESDSSQQEAVQAAKAGLSFVLQGPPGTGKSQTITNIVAECLAAGKTVLFVSEKMAALEVVHSRLTQNGMADFCLEAHSYKANKKAVITELGRTLHAARPKPPAADSELHELSRLKQELNDYASALHKPRGVLAISIYEAYGKLAGVIDAPDLLFALPGVQNVTDRTLADVDGLLERVVNLHHILSRYTDSVWRDLIADGFTQELRQDLEAHLARFAEAVRDARSSGEHLSRLCGVDPPASLNDLRRTIDLAEIIRTCPGISTQWLRAPDLRPLTETASKLSQQFTWRRDKRSELMAAFAPDLFDVAQDDYAGKLAQAAAAATEQAASSAINPDLLIEQRRSITENLQQAAACIDSLVKRAMALARETGLATPRSLYQLQEVLKVVAAVNADLKPTQAWFDQSDPILPEQRLREAQTRYEEYKAKRSSLLSVYNEDALKLDHAEMLARFLGEYSSPLRVFKSGYGKDVATLRSHRKGIEKLTYSQAVADLQQLRELRQFQAWSEANEPALRVLLGRYFQGLDTDWSKSAAALESFRAFERLLPNQAVPTLLTQIMIASGERINSLRRQYDDIQRDIAALEQRLTWLKTIYAQHNIGADHRTAGRADWQSLYAWLKLNYGALQQLSRLRDGIAKCLLQQEPPVPINRLITAARDAEQVNKLEREIGESTARMRESYGELFDGMATDWNAVLDALSWTGKLLAWLGESPALDELIAAVENVVTILPELDAYLPGSYASVRRFQTEDEYFLKAFSRPRFINGAEASSLEHVGTLVQSWQDELPYLQDWLRFRYLENQFSQMRLSPALDALLVAQPPPNQIRRAFYKRLWGLWIDSVSAGETALLQFSGDFHNSQVERFRHLDQLQMRYAKARLAAKLAEARPKSSWSSMGSPEISTLEREVGKQRRHKSVRQLFGEIPNLIHAIKPCLLMSSLSVAQFLDPAKHTFDVVVFDEASQICPEDAVGAIMRSRQLVVVGDSKQLPPTQFFAVGETEDYDDEDEESPDKGILYDSILEECSGAGLPRKMLRWHYRSRCESLIAFSNKHFYSNQLVTFPNPVVEGDDACVSLVLVPDGVYLRGKQAGGGTNRPEARRVAGMVMEHFQRNPHQSLGVIAFSQTQQTAIDDALRVLRQQKPWMEAHFAEDRSEAFFVKNLENVQGDERDVIFFSVGYGKDAAGKMLMNFGPLNKLGGERRLNVAITRAKHRVCLVSSILPSDINPARTSAEGVLLLQKYMEFAQQGVSSLARETSESADAEADSLFEWEVGEALQRAGLTIRRQIGCSGYRIDMAVIDPDHLGRYILGVECDGATYHSSKTARDRDRLRQQVLEGLGWRILRIWSTDWVKEPKRQVQRVLDAVQSAPIPVSAILLEGVDQPEDYDSNRPLFADFTLDGVHEDENIYEPRLSDVEVNEGEATNNIDAALTGSVATYQPYVMTPQGEPGQFYELAENNSALLQIVLSQIVAEEGPVNINIATRRMISGWGMGRAGVTLVGITRRVAKAAERNGTISLRGDFLWPSDMTEPSVRSGGRSIEEIAIEEIEQAILLSLRDAFGMRRNDLIVQTARLFGFKSTGSSIAGRIELAVSNVTKAERIRVEDDLCWPIRK